MRKWRIISWSMIVVFTLLLMEVTLRIQQALGPIYDLEFSGVTLDGISNVINHKPLRKHINKLSEPAMYGEFDGYEYVSYYDSNGIRENKLRPQNETDNTQFKILFMGDSFMQGYDDSNTIPQHVWIFLKEKGLLPSIYNAGFLSYSTAIYVAQSKDLIPKLSPDFVVIDIDETDLGDDFNRYRKLIQRDEMGKIVAVNYSRPYYEEQNGFLKIKKNRLFITRLFLALYHTQLHMPTYTKKYREEFWDGKRTILGFSRDKSENAREKYQAEINFFRENVSELAEALIELMGDRRRILFLYHPHLQHMQPDSDGRYWNRFVSTTVEEVAEEYHVAFYDATGDLMDLSKQDPQDFYWKGNVHFNFKGLKVYGRLVGERIFSLIEYMDKRESADML